MWLFTTLGFFSVVADRDDASAVLVRARAREDLEALQAAHAPELDIRETPEADYRFRASLGRERWLEVARELAGAVDYPNFKDEVARRQGYERAGLYHSVWGVMHELQLGAE